MARSKCFGIVAFLVLVVFLVVLGVGIFLYVDQSDTSSSKGSRAVDTLKFLVLVSRHGNRSPLYSLPNYPISDGQNTTYWPYGGDLSKVGRKQLYNLGKKVRSLYNGFLNSQFFNKDVYVSSTFLQRAVESGKCCMAGLYPPSGKQIWNNTLLWQPVPVHQDSLDKTQFKNQCARFETLETEQETEYKVRWAQNISYFDTYVSSALNGTVSGSLGVLTTWDVLLSQQTEGYQLPDWAESIFPDPMYPMMNDMYVKYVSASDEMTSLTIGPFFAVMMDTIKSKLNGTLSPDRSFYYWSGHDDTLIALQAAVGIPLEEMIGVATPGSAMLLEVHQNSTSLKHFVQVLYIDGLDTSLEPVLLHLPFCETSSYCDYEVFLENTAKFTNVTGSNYDEVCKSS